MQDWARVAALFTDTTVLHLYDGSEGPNLSTEHGTSEAVVDVRRLAIHWRGARRPLSHLDDLRRTRTAIEQLHEQTSFDLLHAHAYPAATATRMAARRLNLPYVVTEHFSRLIRGDARWYHRLEARFALRGAAALTAVGPALADAAERVSGRSVTIVPNPVPDSFSVAPDTEPGPPFTLLSVGRLETIKGFDIGLEAIAKLRRTMDARWLVAGEGSQREALLSQAHRLGLSEHVRFIGVVSREEVHRLMVSAHAVFVPSRSETFSVVAAEALMTGRPVVATRCGGPEWFIGPEQGLLAEVGDSQGLARALEAVLTSRDDFDPSRLAAAARDAFSEKTVEAQLRQVYERVLGDTGHR